MLHVHPQLADQRRVDDREYDKGQISQAWDMDSGKKKVLNLSSGIFGTMRSNYYKMGIRNFLFTKEDDGGTFRAECVMEVDHRNAEEFIVPVFHDSRSGRKISTPITATYQRLSSANVRISYGNHSRPCVIRILRRKDDGI